MPPPRPCACSGSVSSDSTFCRGSRLPSGSWKTICMRRRMLPQRLAAPARRRRCRRRAPGPRWARPAAGWPGPASTCRSRTPPPARRCVPRAMARSTPSTARTWPTVWSKKMPRLIGKCTFRPSTRSSGSASSTGRTAAVIGDSRRRSRPTGPARTAAGGGSAARAPGRRTPAGWCCRTPRSGSRPRRCRSAGRRRSPRPTGWRRAPSRGSGSAASRDRSPAAGTEASSPPV